MPLALPSSSHPHHRPARYAQYPYRLVRNEIRRVNSVNFIILRPGRAGVERLVFLTLFAAETSAVRRTQAAGACRLAKYVPAPPRR